MDIIERIFPQQAIHLCAGPTGAGKCLARGTALLMFDGTNRLVEDIRPGDLLMGPDSLPRQVKALGHGRDEMFRIIPTKGESFTVNSSHILALKVCRSKRSHSRDQFISVLEYLKKSKTFKHRAKLYRTGVNFPARPVPFDPYFIGLWLGDGDNRDPVITTEDKEIVSYLYDFAASNGLQVGMSKNPARTRRYHLGFGPSGYHYTKGKNPAREILHKLRIRYNKHIPAVYKFNSRTVRLEILAGLLDSDGSLSHGGFDFVSKYQCLADDVVYISRSLGLAAYVSPTRKTCVNNGVVGDYWRVSISGDTHEIPTKIRRKQAMPRRQIKNVLHVGFRIARAGQGEYFGFEIDGDGLFLLADFTVTHNTRFLLEVLQQWEQGLDILGHISHPCPWLYVSGDRTEIEAIGTLTSLGINPSTIPIFPAFGLLPAISHMDILREAEKREVNLLVWEGFGRYVESNAGSSAVSRWLNMIAWRLTHNEDQSSRSTPLTIIGVMEQPKTRPQNQYFNPRQRISGPAAWGHSASTIILIEHEDKECRGPLRKLGIYPHHSGPEIELKASLATGHFVIIQ